MTKKQERLLARQLRRDEGLSIKAIARRLGVARSSVSVWVRDIALRPDQREALRRYDSQLRGSAAVAARFRALRCEYQAAGRARARAGSDPLHLAGCMLYWAEGDKSRNMARFTNSDAGMLRFFLRFLRTSLSVAEDAVRLHIYCYTSGDIGVPEIERYWLDWLSLPASCLTRTTVNNPSRASQHKGRKLPYGVCTIAVYSTEIVQHIYGAIQEYAGIDKPEWLD